MSYSYIYCYIIFQTYLSLVNNNIFSSLSVSVGDFQQPFEINVQLKGVMQDASVMRINNARQKSRTLHCGSVSVNQKSAAQFINVQYSSTFD